MKKPLLALAVAAIACFPAFAVAPQGTAFTTLTVGWSYVPNAPACPATSPTNCISGFNVTITQSGTTVFSATAGTGTGQLSPTATSAAWTPAAGVAYGTYIATVTAVGYDANGVALSSTPATGTLTAGLTTLNPPTGVTITGK